MGSYFYSPEPPPRQGARNPDSEVAFGKYKTDHLLPAFIRAKAEIESIGGIARLDEPMAKERKDYALKLAAIPTKIFEGPEESILDHRNHSVITIRYNEDLQRVEFQEKHPTALMGMDFKNSGGAQILDVITHPEDFESDVMKGFIERFKDVVKAAG